MKSVELNFSARDLSERLISMREWLDREGIEPSVFTYDCDRNGAEALVNLWFKNDDEAINFAAAFAGELVS